MNTLSLDTTLQAPCMEFALDEEQQAVADLSAQIFASLSTDDLNVASEKAAETFDATLWEQLVEAGLIEALLPADRDEPGLGMVGVSLIAREQGRYLGRVPFISTAVAALALAKFGDTTGLLEKIAEGTTRVAAVMPEVRHRINGTRNANGWELNGAVELSYMGPSSTHLMVQFHTEHGELLALIDAGRAGVASDEYRGLSKLQHSALEFTEVFVEDAEIIGADRARDEVANWIRPRLLTGAAALVAGATAEAVRRTAAYTSERMQFGRPISTNQGVALRAADAFIDSDTTWLTTIDASWQLDHDDQDAPGEALIAAFAASWCAREGGFRAVHATQHLHGGMGADLDNHIHRFFVWVRELDVLWGSAGQVAEELAEVIFPLEAS